MSRGGGLGPAPRRVLEDAFGAGVMDELPAGDQPLLHGHLAPGAQAIGDVMSGWRGS
jgi:hypothetical protein